MNDDTRWTAVATRDREAAPRFVYAVESTGIFCRAGCPSRTPRRDRVTFFDQPAEARSAGFRACRRCRPEGPADEAEAERVARVRMACALIHAQPESSITELARTLEVTVRGLQRDFQQMLGLSPREYRAACRLSHFKCEATEARDLTAAILDAGYSSSARLYEMSGALGMTPGAYQRGGQDQLIRYASGAWDLGTIVVAATETGICSVRFGDDQLELLAGLQEEFPAAELRESEEQLLPWLELVRAYLDGTTRILELPLDVRGTAFQLKVWAALRAIPRGETRTYGQLAEEIGVPGGARAVAQSCANNELPIAIPCHRVVPVTGDSGGYRWGKEWKNQLLTVETAEVTARRLANRV
jgi:AraC family transcriptional regulator of adaptative response/methylated-DNA-[protein]-cysteine methyltransferase